MPFPLLGMLGASVPSWLPWLTGAGAAAYGVPRLQKARMEGRAPSQREDWLTPYTRRLMATPEYAEAEARRRVGRKTGLEIRQEAEAKAKTEAAGKPQLPPNMFETYEEALSAAPSGWEPELTELGYWSFKRVPQKPPAPDMPEGFYKKYRDAAAAAPAGFIPYQTGEGWWGYKEEERPKTYEKYGTSPYDNPETTEIEGQWNPYRGEWEAPAGWMSPYEKEMLGFREAEMAAQQAEQKRQFRSQLLAQPMSWLQYSAYMNETPVAQPWMSPLGRSSNLQAGQPIPGWNPNQVEGQPMTSLPELATPGAQTWARMGPTAQQQFLGYRQARTGSRPEESLFRMRSTSAPSGAYRGLRWMA